ncbi:MAG: hypothetical protein ACR2N1_13750 [Rubripirellula sp.]
MERRQLLAVTASLTGSELTISGDTLISGVEVELAINANNELVWSQNGGGTFTNNLNTAGAAQTYVMSPPGTIPVDPINVTIELGDGNDIIVFNLDGWTGLQDVTIVDAGDYDFDTVNILSTLDLLPSDGELSIQSEDIAFSAGVTVAAPKGISLSGTGHDALIAIGANATLSARTILPSGVNPDHEGDPSIADSATISFASKTITVADDAAILAHVEDGSPFTAGDIEMSVSEELPAAFEFYDLLSDIATGNVSASEVFNLFDQSATATIDIGAADIRGLSIEMDARVDSDTVIPTMNEIQDAVLSGGGPLLMLQMTSDYLSGELTEFLTATGMFAAWFAKEVTSAAVQIGDNANIIAEGNIVMSATTKSKESAEVDNKIQAFAVNVVDSSSTVSIGEGTFFEAGNNISITTDVTIEASAKAKTAKNLGLSVGPERTAIAVAIAKSFLDSKISVGESSSLSAGDNLTLHAVGDQDVSVSADAGVHVAGGLGVTFGVALPTANVTVDVHGHLKSGAVSEKHTGINILAELDTNAQSVAMSGLGGSVSPPGPGSSLSLPVQAFINTYIFPIVNALFLNAFGSLVGSQLDLSTSMAVINSGNNVAATVHGDATIGSMLDLNVESILVSHVRTFSESVVVQDPTVKPVENVVSVAGAVGLFNNQSTATVHEGAVLDASRDLTVTATSEYPYNKPLVLVEEGGTRVIEIDGNSWARSHSENGKSDLAGSVTYQDYDTVTSATIGDNVVVNQTADYSSTRQSVSVTADSNLYTLDIAGLFELVVDVTAITNTTAYQTAFVNGGLQGLLAAIGAGFVTSWNASDLDFGAGSKKTGVGGSYANVRIDNETTAAIGDSVRLNTGMEGELIVDADAQVHQYSFAMSGIEGGKAGIAGSWARNQHNNYTTANIGAGCEIVAGAISVTSDSDLLAMGFGGGVVQGGNCGFGVSIGTSDVDRQTKAYIGSLTDPGTSGLIVARGPISVAARNQGGIYSFALSGARQAAHLNPAGSSYSTGGLWTDLTSVTLATGQFGLGFSGDAAVNNVINEAHAFINDPGVIDSMGLSIEATDSTAVVAAAGSATLASDMKSVGIAGSFAYNDVKGAALAWLRDATVTVGGAGLRIHAEREKASGVWAATASAAFSRGWFAGAMNASLNYSQWNTEANLYDAVVRSGRQVALTARDDSKTMSIAAAAGWGADYGFGGSFSLNEMSGTTKAGIAAATLDVLGDLTVDADHKAKIVSASGSYGGSDKFVFVVTAAWNRLTSVVGSSISASTVTCDADVLVNARDRSEIVSVTGAVSAYQGSGFGGAFALNELTQYVSADISSSNIESEGSVSVESAIRGKVQGYAVGVAGQEDVGLAGSLVINRINSEVKTNITDSQILAFSDVILDSKSESFIHTFAGGFAGAGNSAVGAAVSLNEINAGVSTLVSESVVASRGNVTVSAHSSDDIGAAAIGGAGAQRFSLGGSLTTNEIKSAVHVMISESAINSGKELVLVSGDDDQIRVFAGGGGGAKKWGIGAGVGLNQIESNVHTDIVDSQLDSRQGISTTAVSASTIKAWAIGGAGAELFALGGGVSTNDIQSNVVTNVLASELDAVSDVVLLAKNADQINAVTGGGAGSKVFGIGAGVSLNGIVSDVLVEVVDSQVNAGNDISAAADSNAAIEAWAIGGAGARFFALGGGVATNEIDSNVAASVLASELDAVSDVVLLAENVNQIKAITGGGAGAKVVGVGAGVSLNEIGSGVLVEVVDSEVYAGGDISAAADSNAAIEAWAIGGAGARFFALGGGVSTNDIQSNVVTNVLASELDAVSDVVLLAENVDQIKAISGGGAGAKVLGVGAGVSLNEIVSDVLVEVVDSQVNAGDDISAAAQSTAAIEAWAIGGAAAHLFAVGGGVSTNDIQSNVVTNVLTSELDAVSDVLLLAKTADQIKVISGGGAGAQLLGIGAGISLNEIISDVLVEVVDSQVNAGDDISATAQSNAEIEAWAIGGAGALTFALGGAVAVNRIGGSACSRITGDSDIVAAGTVSVISLDASHIHVVAPGVAGSNTVAVGVAVVENVIDRTFKAVILDSNITAQRDVLVEVASRGSQRALAVSGALSASVSAAGSSSNNHVCHETFASVDGDSVLSAGNDVAIRSSVFENIDTDVISIAGSGGFSIAGAMAYSHVDTHTHSRVGTDASVSAQGNVSIESWDDTTVDSTVGEAGLGINAGGIGAGVGAIHIHKDVQAYVEEGANVYAAAANPGVLQSYSGEHDIHGNFLLEEIRGIEVQATSNEHVNNMTIGVNGGLGFGVAAAVGMTVVEPNVEAWIGRLATVDADSGGTPSPEGDKSPTNVNVSAVNQSNFSDLILGAGIGGVGAAGAASIGMVNHFVSAHIDSDADVDALYDIDVQGLSQKQIDSKAVGIGLGLFGVDGSASVWHLGSEYNSDFLLGGATLNALEFGGLSVVQSVDTVIHFVDHRLHDWFGLGVGCSCDVDSDPFTQQPLTGVNATIESNAALTAGEDIDVRAREWIDVKTLPGGVGIGGVTGVGAAVGILNLHSDTDAAVFGHLNAGDQTRVQATLEELVDAKSRAGSLGAISGAGAISVVNESSEQTARIEQAAWVESTDELLVNADEILTISVNTGQAGVGILEAGASVGVIHETGSTEAYISDATIGPAAGGDTGDDCDPSQSQVRTAVVRADVKHELVSDVNGLNLGGVALTEFVSAIEGGHQVKAYVGDAAHVVLSENLDVVTDSIVDGDSSLYGLAGSIVSVSSPRILTNVTPEVMTFIQNADVCVGGDIDVYAVNESQANVAEQFSGLAGLSCGSLTADANANPEVRTWIAGKENAIHADGDLVVESVMDQDAVVQILKAAAELAVVGSTQATAETSGIVSTHVGDGVEVNVGNDFSIRSDAFGDAEVDIYAFSISLADFYDNIANANTSFEAESRLGAVDGLWVSGNTLVESVTERNSETQVDAEGGGGYTGGHADVTSIGNGSSEAVVSGKIDATSDLVVRADETNQTVAGAVSAGLSLVGDTSLASRTTAMPVVAASIGADVHASGQVDVLANAEIATHAHGRTVGFKFVDLGETNVAAHTEPIVTAELDGPAKINALGDVNLSAAQTTESAFEGQPTVLGEGATVGLLYNGAGMNLRATSTPRVSAVVNELAAVQQAEDLNLDAVSYDQLSVLDLAAGGGMVSKGQVSGIAKSNGVISSQFLGGVGVVDNVSLNAESDITADTTVAVGVGGGIVSGGANGLADVAPHVSAILGSHLNVAGDVQLRSSSQGDANTLVLQESTGLVVSGDIVSGASVSPTVEAVITEGTQVGAGGSIDLVTTHNITNDGNLIPKGARAVTSGTADAALTNVEVSSTADSHPEVSSRAENLTRLVAGENLVIHARSFNDAVAIANGMAVGAGGDGSIKATADSLGTVEALLDGVDNVRVNTGDIDILAQSRNDAHASAIAAGGGAIAYVNAATADATSEPEVDARIDAESGISAGGNVSIVSLGAGDVRADAVEKSKGGFFNKGAVKALGTYRPKVESLVAENTGLTAGHDFMLAAYGNALDASGDYDTDRSVVVDSLSRGSALAVGRESRSDANVESVVRALLGDGSNVQAGNDVLVNAGSYTFVDVDAFTRLFGLIGSASADAHDHIAVYTITGSQNPLSASGFTLIAGNDVDVISDSFLETESEAEASAIAIGGSTPSATSTVLHLDTLAILGNGSTTTAGNEIFVHANKLLYQTASTTVLGIGVASSIAIYTAETDAMCSGSTSALTAPSITYSSNDPVVSKANATVVDNEISDEDWNQAVKEGRIGAKASVSGDLLIVSGIGKGVKLNSDKVRMINQLQKLDTSANAELKTRRKHNIKAVESEELKLEIHTQLGDDAEINRQSQTDQEKAIGYRAEIKKNKKGKISEKERFREFGGRRGKGKATAASTGFETNKDKRSKDVDKLDLFFELLGRDANGYK